MNRGDLLNDIQRSEQYILSLLIVAYSLDVRFEDLDDLFSVLRVG